jgi:cation diffusion facilitator CzcD-associated flavoprotein CzcO
MSFETMMASFEGSDNEKMNEIRSRCDEVVKDPKTAEGLKAWYRQLCKRPTFHDEYLQTFNRPNVHLVDCSKTRGVERITPKGLVVDGVEYEVDCIIYGSGFEVGGGPGELARKNGFEIIGQNGVTQTQHWEAGMRTFHGMHIHGFPNLFNHGLGQNATYVVNATHNYVEQGKTVGKILAHAQKHGEIQDAHDQQCIFLSFSLYIYTYGQGHG